MSFTCDIQMRCDGCGAVILERRGVIGQDRIKSARWTMQREAAAKLVMTTKRIRRRVQHLCHPCADRP